MLANVEDALALELLAGAQAVEFLAPLQLGAAALAPEIEAVATAIRDGLLVEAVEAEVGVLVSATRSLSAAADALCSDDGNDGLSDRLPHVVPVARPRRGRGKP